MSRKLDFEKDNLIDIDNLTKEFRNLPATLYGYAEIKAEAKENSDLKKAEYKELKAKKYLEIKSREGKITEANVDAQIETDEEVKKSLREYLSAVRDQETIEGYVESMRAKKDMLIQLGADARKE
jgi:hypothetical protein